MSVCVGECVCVSIPVTWPWWVLLLTLQQQQQQKKNWKTGKLLPPLPRLLGLSGLFSRWGVISTFGSGAGREDDDLEGRVGWVLEVVCEKMVGNEGESVGAGWYDATHMSATEINPDSQQEVHNVSPHNYPQSHIKTGLPKLVKR